MNCMFHVFKHVAGFALTQKTCVFNAQIGVVYTQKFPLWFLWEAKCNLRCLIDYFGNFDKKTTPNAFIHVPANYSCRSGPIITHSHTNIKPGHDMDIES